MQPHRPSGMMIDDKESPMAGHTKFSKVAGDRSPSDIDQAAALYEGWPALFWGGLDDLANLRARCGLSQVDLAAKMGISQPEVSRIENQADVKLSTLRAYLDALGAQLHLVAEFGDGELRAVSLELTEDE